MSRQLLRVEGLRVKRGRRQIIDGLSLTVERGQIIAILGPNGTGKSTLLEAIGGILEADGLVQIDGRVATVMQTPGLAHRKVLANVELALSWWGAPRAERRQRAEVALRLMRAEQLANRHASTLSGGERRRVHLARGIALKPDLLLLDEPFAGLDPHTHAALAIDTSSALRSEAGTVLVVLHDRADAWALADRIWVMVDGKIVADDIPERLLANPPTVEVAKFLGHDGELRDADGLILTRAPHLRIDPGGELAGTVDQVVRLEDGAKIKVVTDSGTVWALSQDSTLAAGEPVRLKRTGGVRFKA